MMVASMTQATLEVLTRIPMFRRVPLADRERIAELAQIRSYERGRRVFSEGDESDYFLTVLSGRVKVFKTTPAGKDLILEIFGAGDPLGAVAAYETRPYPASAETLEPSTCLLIPREAFLALLERHPSLVRGLLVGLTHRLIELTNRLTELTGGRVETRFARLFLKIADQIGRPDRGGTFIPLALARQELADLTGTTIETCIRIMSRWAKEGVLATEKDGFVILRRDVLEEIGA